jgi:hypothetical protein
VVQVAPAVRAVPDGRPLNMVLTPGVPGATLLWATWEVLDRDGPPLNMDLTPGVPGATLLWATWEVLDRDGPPLNMDLTRGALAATLLSENQAPAQPSSGPTPAAWGFLTIARLRT